jgi:hypothetical protein
MRSVVEVVGVLLDMVWIDMQVVDVVEVVDVDIVGAVAESLIERGRVEVVVGVEVAASGQEVAQIEGEVREVMRVVGVVVAGAEGRVVPEAEVVSQSEVVIAEIGVGVVEHRPLGRRREQVVEGVGRRRMMRGVLGQHDALRQIGVNGVEAERERVEHVDTREVVEPMVAQELVRFGPKMGRGVTVVEQLLEQLEKRRDAHAASLNVRPGPGYGDIPYRHP